MGSELKPCPFCGGEARLYHCTGMVWEWRVACEACNVMVRRNAHKGHDTDPGRADAITAWNTRSPSRNDVLEEAAMGIKDAWESLPEGYHSKDDVQRWLVNDMSPAINILRRALKDRDR